MFKILFQLILIVFSAIILHAQPYIDRHTTNMTDAWLSCEASQNPVRERGITHWIMYDLGKAYAFGKSTIWNFNVPQRVNSYNHEVWSLDTIVGSTKDGIREFYVDVSVDKEHWTEVGIFTLPEANASSFYEGYGEVNLNDNIGRYLLITPVTNHGGTCYGLSEVRIEIAKPTFTADEVIAKQKKLVDIVPNPATHYFDVRLYNHPQGRASLLIADMQGRMVYSEYLDVKDKVFTHRVHLDHAPSGVYTCTIISGNTIVVEKVEIIR